MQKNYTFKLVVTDDDNGSKVVADLNLPHNIFSNLIGWLPDSRNLDALMLASAHHPSPSVRENVACKDKLSEEVFNILAEDDSVNTLRSLVRSDSFKKYSDEKLVKKLISLDSECARNIGDKYESLEQVDDEMILGLLMNSRDPSIRLSVANNYSTSKKTLKTLINDPDFEVAEEARRRLEN